MSGVVSTLLRTRPTGRAALVPVVLRVIAGAVFVAFSIGKFTRTATYVQNFESYGLPGSPVLVILVGLLELVGGLLLLAGALTRLAALGLALDMVGAVFTAGLSVGGPLHLGLAPALAVGCLVLVWAGAGPWSVDERIAARVR